MRGQPPPSKQISANPKTIRSHKISWRSGCGRPDSMRAGSREQSKHIPCMISEVLGPVGQMFHQTAAPLVSFLGQSLGLTPHARPSFNTCDREPLILTLGSRTYSRGHLATTSATRPLRYVAASASPSQSEESPSFAVNSCSEPESDEDSLSSLSLGIGAKSRSSEQAKQKNWLKTLLVLEPEKSHQGHKGCQPTAYRRDRCLCSIAWVDGLWHHGRNFSEELRRLGDCTFFVYMLAAPVKDAMTSQRGSACRTATFTLLVQFACCCGAAATFL